MSNDDFIKNILRFAAQNYLFEELHWNDQLEFYILCNDIFFWGCADTEGVTEETLPILKQAIEDAEKVKKNSGTIHGAILYCARQRKLRPQGAFYKYLDKELWSLFDACGPEREIDLCNPVNQEGKYCYREKCSVCDGKCEQ
jgi:hypothetical protein